MADTTAVATKSTEELVAEHERMILDLQRTISDMAQGRIVVTHESVEAELYHQSQRIAELQQSVEDLMAGGVATTKTPVRVRISYGPPTKDRGWNFETTVEPTEPDATAIDWDAIKAAIEKSYAIGEAEAIRRDELEGRTRRYFS